MTWLTEQTDERRGIVHVTPNDDLIEHDTDTFGACICGPRPEFCGTGWLFVHHALDGRE